MCGICSARALESILNRTVGTRKKCRNELDIDQKLAKQQALFQMYSTRSHFPLLPTGDSRRNNKGDGRSAPIPFIEKLNFQIYSTRKPEIARAITNC
jgi:hypothetical protein